MKKKHRCTLLIVEISIIRSFNTKAHIVAGDELKMVTNLVVTLTILGIISASYGRDLEGPPKYEVRTATFGSTELLNLNLSLCFHDSLFRF